jgi:hypothetical protein
VRATAAFEPRSARDALTIEADGDTSRLIVDRAAQVVYARGPADDDEWQTVDNEELLAAAGADSLGALFDAFVTGPITPTALEHSTITPAEGLQRITGGGFARRFDVEVPVDYLRPYGALLLANVSDGSIGSDTVPDTITFQVYVNRQAQLALVTSNFMVGPQNFVLSQFFDRKPANVRIELPDVP